MEADVKNLVSQAIQGQNSYAQLNGILGKSGANDVMNESMILHARDDKNMSYQDRLQNFLTNQGGGGGIEVKPMSHENRTPISENIKLRDYVHNLISKGATSLSQDNDTKATFSGLVDIKGLPFAQKLFNQISLFNQRSDVKGKTNPEDRINAYYNIGSSSEDIQSLINSFKGLGGKPVTGDSPLRGNIDMGMGVAKRT